MIIIGDCVEKMTAMPAASIDAVVCDPPYGLGFMGKQWDTPGSFVERRADTRNHFDHVGGNHNPSNSADAARTSRSENARAQAWHEQWAREAFRVLKPGGHLLAFGGTRTYHRLACAVEEAGFEIRDSILVWAYGSGFPKSMDVSKAIDKAAGADREVVGTKVGLPGYSLAEGPDNEVYGKGWGGSGDPVREAEITAPATVAAAQWDGWGTALKPAFEPIVVARKPLAGTVVANVLEHGTGALNIDGCRIAHDEECRMLPDQHGDEPGNFYRQGGRHGETLELKPEGRWPANVVLVHHDDCVHVGTRPVASNGHFPAARPAGSDVSGPSGHVGQAGLDERHMAGETAEVWECVEGCPVRTLDEQTGTLTSGRLQTHHKRGGDSQLGTFNIRDRTGEPCDFGGDSGGASRFYYAAKASRAERNAGLEALEQTDGTVQNASGRRFNPICEKTGQRIQVCDCGDCTWSADTNPKVANHHPTVKPIDVMRWLVRLVTPPGGHVLDPFTGSGTTGIACALEGFEFTGIEQDADYAAIAEARIRFWVEGGENALDEMRAAEQRTAAAAKKQEDVVIAGQVSIYDLLGS